MQTSPDMLADAGLKSKVTGGEDTRDADSPEVKLPTVPLTPDEQLEKAQQDRRIMEALGLISGGFSKAAAGYGGGSVTQLKPDLTAQETLTKMGETGVSDVKDRITSLLAKAKAAKEEKLTDAQIKKLEMDVRETENKIKNGEQMTPYQMAQLAIDREKLNVSREASSRADKREERLVRSNLYTQIRGTLKDDPRFKKAIEQRETFEEIDQLIPQLKSGNQAALAATGTKLARAMGEVGVLTDQDVTRYLGQYSWGRQLMTWWTRGAKGELPDAVIGEIKSNSDLFKNAATKRLDNVYSNAAGRIKSAFPDTTDEEISGMLGTPGTPEKKQEVQQSTPSWSADKKQESTQPTKKPWMK